MSNLAKVILSLIKNYKKTGNTSGLEQLATRIDVLYAAGKLTEEEYQILIAELPGGDTPEPEAN